MFKRIVTPTNKRRMVAEQIISRIRDGHFKLGSKLPPERVLAEEMHVSRSVVREAMGALQLQGVVESRVGDGTYVKQSIEVTGALVGFDQLEAGLSILEALEAREALDITAAHLAIENAQPADLEVITSVLDSMQQSIDAGDVSAYIDLTFDFHVAVANASGNRVVEEGVLFLAHYTKRNKSLIEQNYNLTTAMHSLRVHQAIFDAIAERDLGKAIECVKYHYREYPSLGRRESSSPPRPESAINAAAIEAE